ncbi:hypothetical protein C8Q75DRAFT_802875 [Abortiporus biennis]|nr:hypothetical protein C8Q75DRAFT_802875 [Abortiporus biennis]
MASSDTSNTDSMSSDFLAHLYATFDELPSERRVALEAQIRNTIEIFQRNKEKTPTSEPDNHPLTPASTHADLSRDLTPDDPITPTTPQHNTQLATSHKEEPGKKSKLEILSDAAAEIAFSIASSSASSPAPTLAPPPVLERRPGPPPPPVLTPAEIRLGNWVRRPLERSPALIGLYEMGRHWDSTMLEVREDREVPNAAYYIAKNIREDPDTKEKEDGKEEKEKEDHDEEEVDELDSDSDSSSAKPAPPPIETKDSHDESSAVQPTSPPRRRTPPALTIADASLAPPPIHSSRRSPSGSHSPFAWPSATSSLRDLLNPPTTPPGEEHPPVIDDVTMDENEPQATEKKDSSTSPATTSTRTLRSRTREKRRCEDEGEGSSPSKRPRTDDEDDEHDGPGVSGSNKKARTSRKTTCPPSKKAKGRKST